MRRPIARAAAGACLALAVALPAACPSVRDRFRCGEARQCSLPGKSEPFCEAASSTCSYTDFACPCSWRRHGDEAGDLAAACVAPPGRDGGRSGGRPPPVVISELAVLGCQAGDPACAAADGRNEYVELHNTTSSPIDLSNHVIQVRAVGGDWRIYTRMNGATIPAHGFFLIAHTGYPDAADVKVDRADELDDRHGAARVFVETSATAVDTVSWGPGASELSENAACSVPWPTDQSPPSSVIERKARADSTAATMSKGGRDDNAGNEHDSDDSAADFVIHDDRRPQTTASRSEMP